MSDLSYEIKYMIKVYDIVDWSTGLPYNNVTYGITSGTWAITTDTIDSSSDQLLKIGNAVQKINISKGGNIGTGYSFSFDVTNFEFVKDVLEKGVFFQNLKTEFYIFNGSSYSLRWTGIIDSFTKVKEDSVTFKCVDAWRAQTKTIGSDTVPIALNKNYNCKLVLKEEKEVTLYNRNDSELIYKELTATPIQLINETDNYIEVDCYASGDYADGALNNFYDGYIFVTLGDGAGLSLRINSYTELLSGLRFRFYLEGDLSQLKAFDGNDYEDVSLIEVKYRQNIYTLSQLPVNELHTTDEIKRKTLTVEDDGRMFPLSSPEDFEGVTTSGTQQVVLKNLNEDAKLINKTFFPLFTPVNNGSLTKTYYLAYNELGGYVMEYKFYVPFTNSMKQKIKQFIQNDSDVYIDPGYVVLVNILKPSVYDVLTKEEIEEQISVVANVKIQINYPWGVLSDGFTNIMSYTSPYDIGFNAKFEIVDTYSLKVEYSSFFNEFIDQHIISKTSGDNLGTANILFDIEVNAGISSQYFNEASGELYDGGLRYQNLEEPISVDNVSIGCSGENVESGNEYETVTDTLKYLQTNYMGVSLVNDIDNPSYIQAESDFIGLSPTTRNAGYQIVEQTNTDEVLKTLLFSHHLGMFFNDDGKFALKNWLPKSYMFDQNSPTVADFDETNCIDISDIRRDNLNNVASDIELKYNYNESTGEYDNLIRIKNTKDTDTFSLENSTEGVSESNAYKAEKAWENFQSGWKRIRKSSQTQIESKCIKSFNSDGTGEGEALAFIYDISTHITREHEYITITIPYSNTNFALELLDYVSVVDQKITNDIVRKGWIVERKIDTKKDRIVLTLLLDVVSTDPFIKVISVIQDVETSADIIEDIQSSSDVIQDGDGEQ